MKTSDAAAPRSWALKAALVLIAAGACAFLYVLFAASSKPDPQGISRYAQGSLRQLRVMEDAPAMPRTPLTDSDGRTVTLPDVADGVVLVNFWATWCRPCLTELPTLSALQARFEGRGFQVITVSVDEVANAARARAALERASLEGAPLPFLLEPTRAIVFQADGIGMPTSILYDRRGREIARLTGEADWSSPEAIALIEAALAGEV